MRLPAFELHQPESLSEAISLARRYAGEFDFLAGGTDVLPNYKQRLNARAHLISLTHIPELRRITPTAVGALVRLAELERNPEIRTHYPVIPETVALIASPSLRAAGTIGGNLLLDTRCFFFNQPATWRASKNFCLKAEGDTCLVVPGAEHCYATYSGDLAAPLLVLGATVHLAGPDGARPVPIREFFAADGIKRFVKRPDEILTHVEFSAEAPALTAGYEKLRLRDCLDYPVLGVAAALRLAPDGSLAALDIATTGIDVMPRHERAVTDGFVGTQLTDAAIERLAEDLMQRATPKRNVPMSAAYRKRMVRVLTRRVLTRIHERALGSPVGVA